MPDPRPTAILDWVEQRILSFEEFFIPLMRLCREIPPELADPPPAPEVLRSWIETDPRFEILRPSAEPGDGGDAESAEEEEEMERLGIVIDLSHLNDAGIRDVFAHTRGPVIASHSNARGACFHLRNLSDEMIRQLAERGGVTGINFCPSFLREEESAAKKASTMDMVRHMKYLRNVGGIDIIGLGTDFDGFSGETDVPDTAHMQHLADVMSHEGFTDEEIEKVFSKNVLRVFRECWK